MSRFSRYVRLSRERARVFRSREKSELVSSLRYCLRGRSRPDFVFLQTSDEERYAPMLAVSGSGVRRYCAVHGYEYRAFIGIKRGYYPWHATFNRIVMLKELLDEGYRGWAVYLDADAYVHDASMEASAITRGATRPLIIEKGAYEGFWDVNAGVFMLDLGKRLGRDLVREWYRAFMEIPETALAAAVRWDDVPNDQTLLQRILREEVVRDVIEPPPPDMLNYDGRFVRQVLKVDGTFEERLAAISRGVEATLAVPERPEGVVVTEPSC